jgi:hypothetical protein
MGLSPLRPVSTPNRCHSLHNHLPDKDKTTQFAVRKHLEMQYITTSYASSKTPNFQYKINGHVRHFRSQHCTGHQDQNTVPHRRGEAGAEHRQPSGQGRWDQMRIGRRSGAQMIRCHPSRRIKSRRCRKSLPATSASPALYRKRHGRRKMRAIASAGRKLA